MTYYAKVIAGGKIVIPAELRRQLGIADGDSLVVEADRDGGLHLRTHAQVVKDLQQKFRALLPPDFTGSLVDELIADRRAEAAKEDAEHEAWLAAKAP